jgi:hypothetical protein
MALFWRTPPRKPRDREALRSPAAGDSQELARKIPVA